MKNQQNKKNPTMNLWYIGGMILISLLLIWSSFITVREYRDVRGKGIFEERRPMGPGLFHKDTTGEQSGLKSVDAIQSWMTFQYINFSFGLPSNYLKDILQITDPKYPKISIAKFARKNNQIELEFIQKIQEAVRTWNAKKESK